MKKLTVTMTIEVTLESTCPAAQAVQRAALSAIAAGLLDGTSDGIRAEDDLPGAPRTHRCTVGANHYGETAWCMVTASHKGYEAPR